MYYIYVCLYLKMKKTKEKKAKKTNAQKKEKQPVQKISAVAKCIPYENVFSNGIIELDEGKYSKSYHLGEINFKTAPDESQWNIGRAFGEFLSGFPNDVTTQITLYNKSLDMAKYQQDVLLEMKPDGLNEYRGEFNDMLLEKMSGSKNNITTENVLTVTLNANDIENAIEKFVSIENHINSKMTEITKADTPAFTTEERMEMLYGIFHPDISTPLCREKMIDGHLSKSFSIENCISQGITTKDVIAPSGITFNNNNMLIGEYHAKSFYISNYPTWIKGSLLPDLASIATNVLVSIYYDIIPQEEAVKLIRRKGLNISSGLVEIQKRASKSFIDPNLISPDLQDANNAANSLLEGVRKENERLFLATAVITIFADSDESLKNYEDELKIIASNNLITILPLTNQQEDGLKSSLPLGNNKLEITRLMSTSTISALVPFSVKNVRQKRGLYYGQNAINKKMIFYDRSSGINPNGCILGMPGSGKTFSAKREIVNVLLSTDDEVYIIDPEKEYVPLAKAFGGSVITLQNGATTYLNPFDMNIENADDGGDPIKVKVDFIETVCEIAIGGRMGLSPIEKSIIGRCVDQIYKPYMEYLTISGKSIDIEHAPTMRDFYDALMEQPQIEAQSIALALERFVDGAFDIFGHHTTVEVENRFTVYDIKGIGSGLKEMGLQICLDNIWNKMISNKAKGKRTWFFIDEFYLMMQKPSSAAYISQIWKRARKWNGVPTAITQNIEDMLKSEEARTIISTSAFVMLLGQSPINKQSLSNLLNISMEEQKYISTAKPGMGLIRIDEQMYPMDDSFPKDTKLYKMMTTKPSEMNELSF